MSTNRFPFGDWLSDRLSSRVRSTIIRATVAAVVERDLAAANIRLSEDHVPCPERVYAFILKEGVDSLGKQYHRREVLKAFQKKLGESQYQAYFGDN